MKMNKEKCPICNEEMFYSHKNLHKELIYYCKEHGKIEIQNYEIKK